MFIPASDFIFNDPNSYVRLFGQARMIEMLKRFYLNDYGDIPAKAREFLSGLLAVNPSI